MTNLLDMPDMVMSKIMKTVDLGDVLSLRKVCRDLRNFIDGVKPESKQLKEIEIKIRPDAVEVVYRQEWNQYNIRYEKYEKDCFIFCGEKKFKVFENSKFEEFFAKDLEIIIGLIGSKTILKKLEITWHYAHISKYWRIIKRIKNILKSKKGQKLKVRNFTMATLDQENVHCILQYLDPAPLYSIDIRDALLADCGPLKKPMKINLLVNSEQWKEAQELLLCRKVEKLRIEDFSHFYEVFMEMDEIKRSDMEMVKETFLHNTSSSLVEFDMEYSNFPDDDQFFAQFGAPFIENHDDSNSRAWFFRIPNYETILEILHYKDGNWHVKFMIIRKSSVGRGARIQD